ncbi:MAG: Holliday junction resolvase RuvX [candidate division WOR-3 bacterium]
MPRLLGIDWGKARVGLAVSDPTGTIARPLRVINTKNTDPIREIARTVEDEGIDGVVIGYPLRWDDRESARCRDVLGFMRKLRETLRIPVVAVDEWGSSEGAGSDDVSAARVLQYYLDTGDSLKI